MRSKLLYLSLVAAFGLAAAPAAHAQRVVYCDGCRRDYSISRADMEERAARARERAQERAQALRERNTERALQRAEEARSRAMERSLDRRFDNEERVARARERAAERAATHSRVYRNRW